MSELQFKRAVKKNIYAHIAILGPSGSGKTYTSLRWAYALAPTGKVAALDTEHGSLSKYAGDKVDGHEWRPDVIELESFSIENYITAIKLAESAGYEVLIIDSLSHAWTGKDGLLEFVDNEARKIGSGSGNTFAAWKKGTPVQNSLVEAMLSAKLHLIVTMRVKTEYVVETNEKGKQAPRKIGIQPVQRDGIEYEFDLVCDMQDDNSLKVSKSRCSALSGKIYDKPGAEPMAILVKWLTGEVGAPPADAPAPPPHWSADAQKRKAFWAECGRLTLTNPEGHKKLGVEHLAEYAGTYEDAMKALQAATQ
jgi:hypothetical protein